MTRESTVNGELPVSLTTLEYQPPSRQVRLRILRQSAMAGTVIAGVASVALLTAESFGRGDRSMSNYLVQILLLVLISALGVGASIFLLLERSRTIKNGTISLDLPIRRATGRWSRRVELSEITDIGFSDDTRGFFGAVLFLEDGTKIFLSQKGFGREGLRILDTICTAFGKSYDDGLAKSFLTGTHHRFIVASVRGVENGSLALAASVWTYSKGKTKRIPINQIRKVERISTHYSGDGYLVRLTDGSVFILRSSDVVAAGLPAMASWSSKVEESG